MERITLRQVINQSLQLIYKEANYFFMTYLISLIILFFYTLASTPAKLYLILIPLSVFINTCITVKSKNNLIKADDNDKIFKETIISGIYYFIATLYLLFCLLIFYLLLSIAVFIPQVRSFIFLFLILILFTFIIYFRFIPYIAVIQKSYKKLFKSSLYLIKNNFFQSLLYLCIIGLINSIYRINMENHINHNSYTRLMILLITYLLFYYLSITFEVVFITLVYKNKNGL